MFGGLICWFTGRHDPRIVGKQVQTGWRSWQYCKRCHVRLSEPVEYPIQPFGPNPLRLLPILPHHAGVPKPRPDIPQ